MFRVVTERSESEFENRLNEFVADGFHVSIVYWRATPVGQSGSEMVYSALIRTSPQRNEGLQNG